MRRLRLAPHLALLILPPLVAAGPMRSLAQSVPVRTLNKPNAEYEEPFTTISGLRELSDRRLIVSDLREKTLQLIDLDAGTAQRIGREGQGPGEYSMPMALFGLSGDTTLLFDPLNQRFLTILPNGKPGATFTVGGDPEGPGLRVGLQPPRGVDRRGRLYFQTNSFEMTPDGPKISDSAAIVRYDRATKRSDTLGFVRLPPNQTQVRSPRAGQVMVRMGGGDPFQPQDVWAVAPDGSVAIVHASDYHVEWITPNGRRIAGPAIRYDRVKVTEADKKQWRERLQRGGGIAIVRDGGRGGGSERAQAATTQAMRPEEPESWSEYKPAFPSTGIYAAPDGSIWVPRSRAASDQIPTYDIFDVRGQLVGKVVLPKSTRVAGFGNGTVYVVRADEDDLQYIQKHTIERAVMDR